MGSKELFTAADEKVNDKGHGTYEIVDLGRTVHRIPYGAERQHHQRQRH
jgi:hypothetical protein